MRIANLGAIVWRLITAGLRDRLRRRVAARDTPVIVNDRTQNASPRLSPLSRADSAAEAYLRRIAALTGATQMRNCYVLDVGKTRFFVRAAFVKCLQDTTDPNCAREETCFYPARQEMPAAEKIGTALLQLKNNPLLFAKWSDKSGAFKACGEPVQVWQQQD